MSEPVSNADEFIRLRSEIAALKAERDEARREYCEVRADLRSTPISPEEIATERGWDCFDAKEVKP